jgi:hypothetical protein
MIADQEFLPGSGRTAIWQIPTARERSGIVVLRRYLSSDLLLKEVWSYSTEVFSENQTFFFS